MEKLLASQKTPSSIYRGQEIDGKVILKTDQDLVLDLGGKYEGSLSLKELPEEKRSSIKEGDSIKAFIIETGVHTGQTILSLSPQTSSPKSKGKFGKSRFSIDWEKFKSAKNEQTELSGKILEVNKGGLIVSIDEVRGFLPNSQVGFELVKKVGKQESLAGQSIRVIVSEVDEDSNKLILTQKWLVSPSEKEKLNKYKVGDKAKGEIVNVLPFGLFVAVDDVGGLIFIGEVSWEREENLGEKYKVGQEVEAKIVGIDQDLGRLNLSIKQLQDDPFAKIAEKFQADDVVKGVVKGVDSTGVMVDLGENIEGFIPATKLAGQAFEVGEKANFLVDNVDSQRRKVNLAPFVTSTEGLIYK